MAPATLVAGCTLPTQQLALPGPFPPTGSTSRSPGTLTTGLHPDGGAAVVEKGTGETHGNPEARALVQEAPGGSGITINLVEATIAEAARSILGDTLGLNYVVSDKLKGSITLQTSRPIPRSALLEVFETLLRGEGAAVVVQQGLHRVVPAEEAVANAPLRAKGANYRRLAGASSIVVPLQYVSAAEMERIARSIAPHSHILWTDTTRNLLVIAGTRGELDAITDAVGVFDVDWMKGMSFGIFPIESGDPDAIARELDAIFANDQDNPGKGVIRFIPNRRLKAVLAITSRPAFLTKAETWLRRIETVGRGAERQVHVYRIQHRPAGELAGLLRRVYAAQGPATAEGPRQAPPLLNGANSSAAGEGAPGRPASPAIAAQPAGIGLPEPLPAPGPGMRGAEPGQGPILPEPLSEAPAGAIPEERPPGIGIVADESNNSLIITATAAEYTRIRRILERIDILPNQVLLEATIAEVRLNDDLRMGLRWFFQSGKHRFKFTDDSLAGTVAPIFPGFSHFFNTPNVQVVLNALSRITDVNIVSSPTLTVIDNKKATLQVGDEVPVPTAQAVPIDNTLNNIVSAITYRNTGIILNITPRVSDHGRILLEIEQEASDVVPSPLLDNIRNPPTIQQRRVKTTVSVNDGEGIVLGGLIQDRATNSRDQIPLVGEIPVVGNLFKHKNDEIRRTELLIAITPRVIKDSRQIRAITDEFRDKINMSTRPQRQAPPDRKEQIDRVLR